MSVTNNSEQVLLKINEELNTKSWQKSFNYSSLIQENPKWCYFENIKRIIDYIRENLEFSTFEVSDQHIILVYVDKQIIGKKEINNIYQLKCYSKVDDISMSLNYLSSSFQDIKQSIDYMNKFEDHAISQTEVKGLIDTKVNSLEKNINLMTNLEENLVDEGFPMRDFIIKIQKAIPSQDQVKLELSIKEYNTEHYEISNKSKSFKKKSNSSWQGLFFNEKVVFDDQIKEYSIKLDKITSSYLKFGFAVGGQVKENGLHNSRERWMLYFNDGTYCCTNGKNVFRASLDLCNKDVITACIDTKESILYFKINGKEVGYRKRILMNNPQKKNLFPCLDLHTQNDQITLI